MEMKVDLAYIADEEYTGINASGNKVAIDMLKEDKRAMSPTELLLTAVGACGAVDLVSMVKKRRKELRDLKAVVTGKRREEHPRSFTDIHVRYRIFSADLTEKEAERIVKLAVEDYCSVGATVNRSASLTHSFEIIR